MAEAPTKSKKVKAPLSNDEENPTEVATTAEAPSAELAVALTPETSDVSTTACTDASPGEEKNAPIEGDTNASPGEEKKPNPKEQQEKDLAMKKSASQDSKYSAFPPTPDAVGSGRFKMDTRLASGSFGQVWSGTDTKQDTPVAIKLELKQDSVAGTVVVEYEILHDLKTPVQKQGFVELFYFGREGPYVYMVMEVLGKSLEDWIETSGKFNVKTAFLLGVQMLQRIEYLHSKSILHRDIKPDNFMMGVRSRAHICYIVDFGLSEKYYLEGQHLNCVEESLTGTARYASVSAHTMSQSRRDDMESVGYMLIYLMKGDLPWQNLRGKTEEEEFLMVRDRKRDINLNALCQGLPDEMLQYITCVRNLKYKQCPDYGMLRELFFKELSRLGTVRAHQLQWLESDLELQREALIPIEPWMELEQPDDGDGWPCCRRRRKPPAPDQKPPSQLIA